MATTTVSVSVSDNNIVYETPDEFYVYDNATHVVTTDATVSGSNSGFDETMPITRMRMTRRAPRSSPTT